MNYNKSIITGIFGLALVSNGILAGVDEKHGNKTMERVDRAHKAANTNKKTQQETINANQSLAQRLAALRRRIDQLEINTAFNVTFNVDCSENPNALREEFQKNLGISYISFEIAGDCYGDIASYIDENGELTTYQPHHQSIHIKPMEGETSAGLIPNPDSGSVTIWGGFGGGLYLNDLTITLGEGSGIGVAFSRNGQGSVNNTKIIGPDDGSSWGILVQAGAQVYINGTTTQGVWEGVRALENSSVRLIGDNAFSAQSSALVLRGGAVSRISGTNDFNSIEAAGIYVGGGSTLWQQNGTINTPNGMEVVGHLDQQGEINTNP